MPGELYSPREVFTGEAEYTPNIRERIRSLSRVVLLGEPGAGKTFLLARLAKDYAEAYSTAGILPIFVPLSKYTTKDDFETFCKGRMGQLAETLDELQVVWLLDALNEMPDEQGQRDHLKEFIRRLVSANTPFVLTCRVKDYEQELAHVPQLYRVDLQELNPQQIYDILSCYLREDVDSIWEGVLKGEALRKAWGVWKDSVRDFWDHPERHTWNWDEHERVRKAFHDDPRKLLLLCRSPFTLVKLLIPRFGWAMENSQASGQPLLQVLENALPNNRAELFREVINRLLEEESKRQGWQSGEIEAITEMLETTATALQANEQRTEMALSDLWTQSGVPSSSGLALLKKGRDAGLVSMSETSVRFTHQLFQEYFATRRLRDLLSAYDARHPNWEAGASLPPQDDGLAALFPQWWKVEGWRVTVTLLGELVGKTGISRVVRWLASYAPEIALGCVVDNNDGVKIGDLSGEARDALIAGARSRTNEVNAAGRAAAYRVLGHPQIDADNSEGVGRKVHSGMNLPEIVWGDPVVPGKYVVGGDEKAYLSLHSATISLPYTYRLAKYPVTVSQFASFVEADREGYNHPEYWTAAGLGWKGSRRAPERLDARFAYQNHPRVGVSWYEALAFCRWLSVLYRGLGLIGEREEISLPTEREWEISAHSGKKDWVYPYGNDFDASKGNYDETGIGQTSAVGLFPDGASPYGVLDMSGNVWEWCLTGYEDGSNDPHGTASRVLRGGSWFGLGSVARARSRGSSIVPNHRHNYFGFRIVCLPHSALRL